MCALRKLFIATQQFQIIHANLITEHSLNYKIYAIPELQQLHYLPFSVLKPLILCIRQGSASPIVLRPWVQVRQVKPSSLT